MKRILIVFFTFFTIASAFAAPVQTPELLIRLTDTGTSFFGSPIIHSLGTGDTKLVGTFYSIFVWDAQFNQIAIAPPGVNAHQGRIYPPAVCADLDADGIYEVVVASAEGSVAAYEWKNNNLTLKTGWPASACDGGYCPEVRGIAGGDLDGDGDIEIVVTTVQTMTEAQVFVFNPDGTIYQPADYGCTAWPRYNMDTGECGDADDKGQGNDGVCMLRFERGNRKPGRRCLS